MPQYPGIETYQRRVGTTTPILPQRAPVVSLGPSIAQLGDAVQQVDESNAALHTAKALSEAQLAWSKRMQERMEQAQPGAENFTPDTLKEFDEYSQKMVGQARSGLSKKFLADRLLALRGNVANQALGFEANERVKNVIKTVQDSNDVAGNELLTNPTVFAERLAERRALIDAMPGTPELKRKLHEETQASLSKYAVQGKINSDPYYIMEQLASQSPTDLSVSALNPEQRVDLMRVADAALHQRVADAQRLEVLHEKQLKEIQDKTAKDGDAMLANGQLGPSWIEAHRESLSPEDFRYFYTALRGENEGSAPRDVATYADLRDRAGRGEDVRKEAREALQQGRIRVTDYDRLYSEVESERPGWYKRGAEYISTMSGVSQLNPDPAGAQNKATMLDQWGDWASKHTNASDREAQVAYQDIVSHNALVKLSGLPSPILMVGSRLQMDLKATEAATVKAFKSGQIDQQEFERQAKLLKEWRAAMMNAVPEAKP